MKAESEGRDPWRRLQSPRFDGVSASGLELPRARVLSQVLQRGGGSRPVALTSEHYGRPLPLPVDSVRRSPLPVCSSPSSLGGGCAFPLTIRAELVPGRTFSSGHSLPPRTLPPPKSWVQCLLSHSNASNEGASRRSQCGLGCSSGKRWPILAGPPSPSQSLPREGPLGDTWRRDD